MRQLIRGHIVAAPSPGALDITENGYIALESGVIRCVSTERPDGFADAPVQDFGDRLILQSFADMHLHAPQYAMLGLGMDVPLLEWLQRYTYPVEARFADAGYAREVFERLAQALIANGTTRVCIFSSLHTDATLLLMEALERAGVTGYAGKVNMDRNGGDGLQETTAESRRETLRWLDACDRFSRVRPMLTPRFVPSCTDALLAFLGRLSRERKLPVQSHLSENREEMALVRRLHPDCEQYWQVYDKYGLFHSQTVMAHCVHSDARERAALRANGVLVAHAPDSNVNICSGFAPVRKASSAAPNRFISRSHCSFPRGSVYSMDGAHGSSFLSSIAKVSPKLVTAMAAAFRQSAALMTCFTSSSGEPQPVLSVHIFSLMWAIIMGTPALCACLSHQPATSSKGID